MPTLGEELKRRREERGITLVDISEATRIGTRFLKAIESDDYAILPGGIFTRSFIRAYAKQVGLDEDEAMALYHQQVVGQTGDLQQHAPTEHRPKPSPPVEPISRQAKSVSYRQPAPRTNWSTVVIAIGIVFIFGIILLAFVNKFGAGKEDGQLAGDTSKAPEAAPRPAAPSSNPQAATGPDQPASNGQPDQTQNTIASAGAPLVVKVEAAMGDAWVKYQVDDDKPTAVILKQGQAQEIPAAQNQVKLNYGNRLALKLKINDREAYFPPDAPKFQSQIIISLDRSSGQWSVVSAQ